MKKSKCKIIFFGTPEFAVPTLKALNSASFCHIQKVITQTDKPIGRHHSKLVASPVKQAAQDANIPVILNEAKQSEESRESCSSDFDEILHCVQDDDIKLGILVAYGDIIPKKIIDSFPLGILNLHPSLLPKYRGSSPIQSAILNQDKQTGVTIMKLDDKMDHGPVVAQQTVKLDQTETTGELHNKLAIIGADLMIKILPDYIAGKIELKEQNHDKATFTEKLSKKDGKIDWNSTAQVEPLVRAMNPWPGAWTIYKDKKLIIWSTQKDNTPKEVQLEGKKKMAFKEFLKGHPDFEITDSFLSR